MDLYNFVYTCTTRLKASLNCHLYFGNEITATKKTVFGHEFAVVGEGMNSNQVILVGERGRRPSRRVACELVFIRVFFKL